MKPPLLRHKAYDEPSVFAPENLLREARRQNHVEHEPVTDICLPYRRTLPGGGCPIAHVTNQMAIEEGDFEKGQATGVRDTWSVFEAVVEGGGGLFSENVFSKSPRSHERWNEPTPGVV